MYGIKNRSIQNPPLILHVLARECNNDDNVELPPHQQKLNYMNHVYQCDVGKLAIDSIEQYYKKTTAVINYREKIVADHNSGKIFQQNVFHDDQQQDEIISRVITMAGLSRIDPADLTTKIVTVGNLSNVVSAIITDKEKFTKLSYNFTDLIPGTCLKSRKLSTKEISSRS
ncbi:hypothetical protein ACJMK2_018735 [Sinanodonta woodiana]|uniref:Uncharacterized protein n=1 Tax=Sinanodonta woodiana TaxID=1069815 RepID=A0ABD3UEB3_SINWO